MRLRGLGWGIAVLFAAGAAAQERPLEDAGAPFGKLPLVDEVRCGEAAGVREFAEHPKDASTVETLLGTASRVLPNAGAAKYFAYKLGKGKGLKAGQAYVLAVDFPEDRPRTWFVLNRGAEYGRGWATGSAVGDVLYTYTNNNAESLEYPLAQQTRSWRTIFWLHDRFAGLNLARDKAVRDQTPTDGFWVVVTQADAVKDPLNAGAAVSRIRLFEVPDPKKFDAQVQLPPKELPHRRLFWREEMADGVIGGKEPAGRGLDDETAWYRYKAELMRVLGMNVLGKDLLEFGHNQGWEAEGFGGNDWYWSSHAPKRWEKILAMLKPYGYEALPYYEWSGGVGAKGLGKEKRAKTLGGKETYTHIEWTEKSNVDLTDPDALADAKRLLDATVLKFKGQAAFAGAWFRPRPSQNPIGFGEATLARFAQEAHGNQAVTREALKGDRALLEKYYAWWYGKRRAFLAELHAHLKAGLGGEPHLLYTCDPGEPGPSLPGGLKVVTDRLDAWGPILKQKGHEKLKAQAYDEVLKDDLYLKAIFTPHGTWADWEWQHAVPVADPQRYQDLPGVLLTYPFNRSYTVRSEKAFEAFRGPAGLALLRHYPLNEHAMHESLGYFVSDLERAGPFAMEGEALALAYGDPTSIGYLSAASFNRGFPEYVRAFNRAFLALPALPSKRLPEACADAQIVVRAIDAKEHGTYLAVVNVSRVEKKEIVVKLPKAGAVSDAATGAAVPSEGGAVRFSMYPYEVRALRVKGE